MDPIFSIIFVLHRRLLYLHINNIGWVTPRNRHSSRIPTVFKIHFTNETRLTGALCPNQEHLQYLFSKSSNTLQLLQAHWGPQPTSLLNPSIKTYISSTLALNNSRVTSKPRTYKEQNAAEGQNLSTCSQQRATREKLKQRSNRVNFFFPFYPPFITRLDVTQLQTYK